MAAIYQKLVHILAAMIFSNVPSITMGPFPSPNASIPV